MRVYVCVALNTSNSYFRYLVGPIRSQHIITPHTPHCHDTLHPHNPPPYQHNTPLLTQMTHPSSPTRHTPPCPHDTPLLAHTSHPPHPHNTPLLTHTTHPSSPTRHTSPRPHNTPLLAHTTHPSSPTQHIHLSSCVQHIQDTGLAVNDDLLLVGILYGGVMVFMEDVAHKLQGQS